MAKKAPDKSAPQHFFKLLKKFEVAMMVTGGAEQRSARPMRIAQIDDQGTIWFLSSLDAERTRLLEAEPSTTLLCQSRTVFLSLTGKAQVVKDQARIDELWSAPLEVWFPEGRAAPDLVLIAVSPISGEYWDQSGAHGIRYLFEAVKAWAANEEVKTGEDIHASTPLEEPPLPENQKDVH